MSYKPFEQANKRAQLYPTHNASELAALIQSLAKQSRSAHLSQVSGVRINRTTSVPKTPLTASDPSETARDRKAQIQVIARAVAVLRTLECEPEGLSLSAIAQRLKLPRSTVQRIVGALEAEHLIIPASPHGGVRLGPALLRFSAAAANSATNAIVKPYMVELTRQLGQTVDLSMMGRGHAIFVDQVPGDDALCALSAIAESFPLHCTANGKAMLALMSDVEIERLLGQRYIARTAHTCTTLSALLADLHAIRRTGLALDHEEHSPGVCAFAIGFQDGVGNRMALSIPVASARFEELKPRAAEYLLALRDKLVTCFATQ